MPAVRAVDDFFVSAVAFALVLGDIVDVHFQAASNNMKQVENRPLSGM